MNSKMERLGGSKSRDLPKFFQPDEVARLMAIPNIRRPTGLRNRAMMELMHRCGTRVGETCGIHVRDVKWSDGRINLRAAITKGNREAWIYVDSSVMAWLEQWKARRRQYAVRDHPELFITLKGAPVSPNYCWQMMQRYGRRAGIEGPCHPHMLRHTFATELINDGFNLKQVQHAMRHSNIQTTSVYLHIADPVFEAKIKSRKGGRSPK